MSERPDVEFVLRAWFDEGPATMSDRVVDVVAQRISRQPQQRSRRVLRRTPMNALFKVAAALAAVVVVAVVGWNLLPGRSPGVGGPAASSSPSPSPSASPGPSATAAAFECEDALPGCAGKLADGPHSSSQFTPALSFSTAGQVGWVNSLDLPMLYKLDSSTGDYLLLWSDVAIAQHTETCEPIAQPGVGNEVQDWIDYVTSHPGIVASVPAPVDLGDAHGQVVDLGVRDGWTKGCPNLSFPTVQFIMNAGDSPAGTYGAARGQELELTVLDVGGETVLITHYGSSAQPDAVVATMRFDPTAP
jgi:hypothetical protein